MKKWLDLITECKCISLEMSRPASIDLSSVVDWGVLRNELEAESHWVDATTGVEVVGGAVRDAYPGQFTRLAAFDDERAIAEVLNGKGKNPWALRNPQAFYGPAVMGKLRALVKKGLIVAVLRDKRMLLSANSTLLEKVARIAYEKCEFDQAHRASLQAIE